MKNYNIIIVYSIFFFSFVFSQKPTTLNKETNKSKNKAPTAIAGKNIQTYPGATITISGKKSEDPDEDLLQYIWSFPPSLIFENNYKYDKTDRFKIHKNSKDKSINIIETYTRAFLVDIPDSLPIGSKYTINLTVKDAGGLSSTDSFILKIVMPDSSQIVDKNDDSTGSIEKNGLTKNTKNISVTIQAVSSNRSATIKCSFQ